MTEEEFKSVISANVESFFSFWKEGQKLYPSQFPEEMNYSDWFEQFVMYAENKSL